MVRRGNRRAAVALVAVAALAGLLASLPTSAHAQEHFDDTAGHYARAEIESLVNLGVLGDEWSTWCGDRQFCPNDPVQRWMAAVWMVRAIDGRDPAPVTESRFSDINPESYWAPHVERIAELGLAYGYTDGTFGPFVRSTRGHAALFLERGAAALTGRGSGEDTILRRAGLISSHICDDGGIECASEHVTRGELAALISHSMRGTFFDSPASPPFGAFKSISAGATHTCGIRDDDTIYCWGFGLHGQTEAPEGKFADVSAGAAHTCAVYDGSDPRTGNSLICWGRNNHSQAFPPGGSYKAVTAGDVHSCAIRMTDTVTCWGTNRDNLTRLPFRDTFSEIDASGRHTCGLRTDPQGADPSRAGSVACWGASAVLDTPDGTEARFSAIATGQNFSCGIYLPRGDVPESRHETVGCFGRNFTDEGQLEPPDLSSGPHGKRPYLKIDAGWHNACGIVYHPAIELLAPHHGERDGGLVECWGSDSAGQSQATDSYFINESFMSDISVGGTHGCGILLVSREVKCWGFDL